MKTFHLRLPAKLMDHLKAQAGFRHMSVQALVLTIIENWVNEQAEGFEPVYRGPVTQYD